MKAATAIVQFRQRRCETLCRVRSKIADAKRIGRPRIHIDDRRKDRPNARSLAPNPCSRNSIGWLRRESSSNPVVAVSMKQRTNGHAESCACAPQDTRIWQFSWQLRDRAGGSLQMDHDRKGDGKEIGDAAIQTLRRGRCFGLGLDRVGPFSLRPSRRPPDNSGRQVPDTPSSTLRAPRIRLSGKEGHRVGPNGRAWPRYPRPSA